MGIGERIKNRREEKHISRSDLAKQAGIPYATLAGIENGDQNSTPKLWRVAEILTCRVQWLETGDGEIEIASRSTGSFDPQQPAILRDENPTHYGENFGPARRFGTLVPLISWVQAGDWSDIVDNFSPGDADEWLPAPKNAGPRSFFLEVEGESMYNPGGKWSYRPGQKICVDPDHPAENLDRVIVRLDDKRKTTFKQLIMEGGRMYLKALNPNWPEKIIEVNESATICGVVIGRWVDE